MNQLILRLVLAISLDGRIAFSSGGKSQLGGKGDRKVLEESLSWCDATLMGARTIQAHQNTCLIHESKLIKQRLRAGLSEQPISIVISQTVNFCLDWPYFNQPIERWILTKTLSNVKGFERQLEIQENWDKTLDLLRKEGLSRLVILGGATLATSLLQSDLIDELQLTVVPRILGGSHIWIPTQIQEFPDIISQSGAWELRRNERLSDSELVLLYSRKI